MNSILLHFYFKMKLCWSLLFTTSLSIVIILTLQLTVTVFQNITTKHTQFSNNHYFIRESSLRNFRFSFFLLNSICWPSEILRLNVFYRSPQTVMCKYSSPICSLYFCFWLKHPGVQGIYLTHHHPPSFVFPRRADRGKERAVQCLGQSFHSLPWSQPSLETHCEAHSREKIIMSCFLVS